MSFSLARLRPAALAMAMMPPWVAYLVAVLGWQSDGWVDADQLALAMQVEWVSAPLFPVVAAIAIGPSPMRAVRVAVSALCATGLTAFVWQKLGPDAAALLWLGGGVTYIGWLWARPGEVREETLAARTILTIGCAFPVMIVVLVLVAITGVDSILALGLVYFLTLHLLDATGTHARFARWLAAHSEAGRRRAAKSRTSRS